MPLVDAEGGATTLYPGDPGYIDAVNALGYQFGEDTPSWVLDGLPPITVPAEPGTPPRPVPPTATPPVGRVPAPGVTGQPGGQPAVTAVPVRLPDLNPFDGIAGRLLSLLGDAVGAAFEATTAVSRRIATTVTNLAEATLPTIEELATGAASLSMGALSFIADNLTDMADFGATLASALVEPLYALLDAAGDKVWDFIARFLAFLQRAAATARQSLMGEAMVERLI